MAYAVKKWDLTQLFPGFDSPELQGAFDNVDEQVTSFEGVRNKLNPNMDAATFLDVVRASESDGTSLSVNSVTFPGTLKPVAPPNDFIQRLKSRVRIPDSRQIQVRLRDWRTLLYVFGGVMSGFLVLITVARAFQESALFIKQRKKCSLIKFFQLFFYIHDPCSIKNKYEKCFRYGLFQTQWFL